MKPADRAIPSDPPHGTDADWAAEADWSEPDWAEPDWSTGPDDRDAAEAEPGGIESLFDRTAAGAIQGISGEDPVTVLRRVFGYDAFRGEQAEIIDHVVGGGDALVLMPTGGGKSLCYQIPALVRDGVGVVDLAADRADAGPGRRAAGARRAGRVPQLHAGHRRAPRRSRPPFLAGELDLLYLAPERLRVRRPRCACWTAARSRCSRSTRRTASPSGATTSGPTTSRCRRCTSAGPTCPRIALTATATEATARRDRHPAQARRTPGTSSRASTGPTSSTGSRRRTSRAASCSTCCAPSTRATPASSTACRATSVEKTAEFLVGNGIAALPYHAGLDARTRAAQPVAVPARGRRGHGRDDRVRHGHRQAGRAVRRPPRPAQVGRGLLPGDRPRRPRRAAVHRLAGVRARRTSSSSAR